MIEYKISSEERLILLVNYKKFSIDELQIFRKRLRNDPDYSDNFDIINDVQRLRKQYSNDEIQAIAQERSPKRRVAMIASSDLSFGKSRVWEMMCDGEGDQEIQIFRDIESAIAWLGKDKSIILSSLDDLTKGRNSI